MAGFARRHTCPSGVYRSAYSRRRRSRSARRRLLPRHPDDGGISPFRRRHVFSGDGGAAERRKDELGDCGGGEVPKRKAEDGRTAFGSAFGRTVCQRQVLRGIVAGGVAENSAGIGQKIYGNARRCGPAGHPCAGNGRGSGADTLFARAGNCSFSGAHRREIFGHGRSGAGGRHQCHARI